MNAALSEAGPARAWPKATQTQWAAMRYFAGSRLVVALLLASFVLLSDFRVAGQMLADRQAFLGVALLYVGLAVVFMVAVARLHSRYFVQLIAQVITDLVVLTLLMHAAGGIASGFGTLCVAAVAAAAVLSPTWLAGSFAAAATLLLLGESVVHGLGPEPVESSSFMQAGLVGAACFATAYVVSWLAQRLNRQESLARQRGEDLRNQLAITQLVIAELQQGVLVVGESGELRTYNRTAHALLGTPGLIPMNLLETMPAGAWSAIAQAFRDWRAGPGPRLESMELELAASPPEAPRHRVRLRFLRPAGTGAGDTVLVIEDQRSLEERAQQLKLAAMGRLSASIAHEIRNPLGAIRHANSLLAEQLSAAPLQRLSRIVETNSVRINRIVEDVLQISRRDSPTDEAIDLREFFNGFLPEFVATAGADPQRIAVALESAQLIRFDTNQLRQVMVNLLGNALRYASVSTAAVLVEWARNASDRLELRIADDGPGLTTELLPQVFEPFFTTEARGTGLGLYLARELCHANGAAIRYEFRSPGGRYRGAFVIEPRLATVPATAAHA